MEAGAASITINNDIGTLIQGAGDPDQRVEGIRDDLEANALYLSDGEAEVMFISCDLGGLQTRRVEGYKSAIAGEVDIPTDNIMIGCSHTHAGPVVLPTNYSKPVDEQYSERLQERLCRVAAEAVESTETVRMGWGTGNARLGYNRRACYADGTHTMYRRGPNEEEYTGVEGPDDTECLALAVFDRDSRIKAVLHHGTGHPASMYGSNVLSAEFPGLARQLIRDAYGELPVLFFNGCQGDIAMRQLHQTGRKPVHRDAEITRFGSALAGETLRIIHEMELRDDVSLSHRREEFEYPVRLPEEEMVEEGRKVLERIDEGENITGMDVIFAWGPVSLAEKFGDEPVDQVGCHVVCCDDLVIVTQPFELFCQYQIDLKRRSPARDTHIFGLTDGFAGYLPTLSAELGGGYSGTPFLWARFGARVGCQLVDDLSAMTHKLWSKSKEEKDI